MSLLSDSLNVVDGDGNSNSKRVRVRHTHPLRHSILNIWLGNFRDGSSHPGLSAPTGVPSFTTTMFLSAIAPLLLLPYAAAAGVHKLKLKKLDIAPADINPVLESAYLAEKYGAQTPAQMPLLGIGGQGRRLDSRPTRDDLYWTQEEVINGGHNVPLTSSLTFFLILFVN
jgi:hypothetical protein